RRRYTRLQGDWSSDVCSSDLLYVEKMKITESFLETTLGKTILGITKEYLEKSNESISAKKWLLQQDFSDGTCLGQSYTLLCVMRSEERRVGKEGRSWWWQETQ